MTSTNFEGAMDHYETLTRKANGQTGAARRRTIRAARATLVRARLAGNCPIRALNGLQSAMDACDEALAQLAA
jgi:hypothetical protein